MLEEGALPEQIDKVMVDFGYPDGAVRGQRHLGPRHQLRHAQAARRRRTRTTAGCRSPTAWWRWAARARRPAPAGTATRRATARRIRDPEVHRDHQGGRGGAWASSSAASPTRRSCAGCCSPRVNEACKILEEGKALRASDIDVMWLNGFGFPRYRGGLMFWADGIGAREVYNQIAAWHQRYGARWRPPSCCASSPSRAASSAKLKAPKLR